MRSKGRIIGIGICSMLLLLCTAAGALSGSFRTAQQSSKQMTGISQVYVGEMHVEGTGDFESAIVTATAEKELRIHVDLGGSDVIVRAHYDLNCLGLFDYGYVKLWVQNVGEVETDTDHLKEGYLYLTIPDCHRLDTINWVVMAIYDDLLFPGPIIKFDIGGGICSKPLIRTGLSMTHTLAGVSGTIVCK